jgi:hypothetical protein
MRETNLNYGKTKENKRKMNNSEINKLRRN